MSKLLIEKRLTNASSRHSVQHAHLGVGQLNLVQHGTIIRAAHPSHRGPNALGHREVRDTIDRNGFRSGSRASLDHRDHFRIIQLAEQWLDGIVRSPRTHSTVERVNDTKTNISVRLRQIEPRVCSTNLRRADCVQIFDLKTSLAEHRCPAALRSGKSEILELNSARSARVPDRLHRGG